MYKDEAAGSCAIWEGGKCWRHVIKGLVARVISQGMIRGVQANRDLLRGKGGRGWGGSSDLGVKTPLLLAFT